MAAPDTSVQNKCIKNAASKVLLRPARLINNLKMALAFESYQSCSKLEILGTFLELAILSSLIKKIVVVF